MKSRKCLFALLLASFIVVPSSAWAINCNHPSMANCQQECARNNRAHEAMKGCWWIIGCWWNNIEATDAANDLLECIMN